MLAKEIFKVIGLNCTNDFRKESIEKIDQVLDSSPEDTNEEICEKIITILEIDFPNRDSIKEQINSVL